jgi:hypothetical protein
MATRQLTCKDLRAGDILLKVDDGSLLGGAIKLGQSMVGGKNARVIHAGIMFDKHFSIESQGSGVSANDIRVQNKKYGYHVFRPNNANLGQGAGTCAKMMFDIHKAHGSMKYSIGGAIGSLFSRGSGKPVTPGDMDALLDRILAGRNSGFFCSQFVVYVYQFVAEQNGMPASSCFNYSDAKAPPTLLAASLVRNSTFTEVGYLLPNER